MKVASSIPAQYSREFDFLLNEHHKLSELFHKKFSKTEWDEIDRPKFSYLDLKIEIVDKIFECCVLCEKNCKVDRRFESGACGVKKHMYCI